MNGLGDFYGQGYYSAADAVIHTTSYCFPGATSLVLDEERNFYALFYALTVRVATKLETAIMNFLSTVPAG